MNTKETIEETYKRTICYLCKNKDNCQNKIETKSDGTIKCDNFITTFVRREIDTLMYGTRW